MRLRTQLLVLLSLVFLPESPLSADEFEASIVKALPSEGVSSQLSSSISSASTTVIETSTSFYSFKRYPEDFADVQFPWKGPSVDGITLQSDQRITVWYVLSGIWKHEIAETWVVEIFHPDGTVLGGLMLRSAMETVNGVFQKCYTWVNVLTGQDGSKFCADDPDRGVEAAVGKTYFGVSRFPNSSTPVEINTVKFSHNDNVLWDSQYLMSALRLLNPNPGGTAVPLLDNEGQVITNDPASLFAANAFTYKVTGAVADGITPIVVRVRTLSDLPVTLSIVSGTVNNGTLTTFDGAQGPGTVVMPPIVQTTNNKHFVGALYEVPDEFNVSFGQSRVIKVRAEVELPNQEQPGVIDIPLTLYRIPVLLIHGMWSSPDVWSTLRATPAFSPSMRAVATVDWRPAETHLESNIEIVEAKVESVMNIIRGKDVAVTQVDVVTHSAGGQLARLWIQDSRYRRRDNLMAGDFRKLVTVGTPHQGTPLATLVQQLRATNSFRVFLLEKGFDFLGKSLTNGIIEDQVPNAITFQPTPVSSHAYIGEVTTVPEDSDESDMWEVLANVCSHFQEIQTCQGIDGPEDGEQLRSNVFGIESNDGVVGTTSQAGGLSAGARSPLADTVHTQETDSGLFVSGLPGLLDNSGGFDPSFP